MNVTQLYGTSEADVARALIGGDVIADVRNDLLKQVLVAVANKTSGGSGDVVGPAASTDGAVVLWDGLTGKLLQDSPIFITGGGTVALGGFTLTVPATGTAALLGVAQTFTAANIFSANGAASTPALTLNGTIFTGGSATTTKPFCLLEPAGTTSTGWSTAGTMLGVNAPSGFTGHLLDLQLNGISKASFDSDGSLTINKYGTNISIYSDDGVTLSAYMAIGRWHCRDFNDSSDTANLGRDSLGGMALGKDVPFVFSSTATWYGTEACRLLSGTGSPESAVAAGVGSLFLRQDGGANTTLYIKESGTGNTGWVAK